MDNDTLTTINVLTGMFFGGLMPLLIMFKLDFRNSLWKNICIAWGLGIPAGAGVSYAISYILCL